MKKILILFAHPALEKSRVNKVLIQEVRDLPGVTFRDMYELYPDFAIDIEEEQNLLEGHDILVLQHPFFWYSTPSLLKEWQDLVLEHGWAYGSQGNALRGKTLLSAITTGGREEAYREGGYNRFTMRHLLAPIEQTAFLCGMEYLPPFVVHGTHGMKPDVIRSHAKDYRLVIEALRDEGLDLARSRGWPQLNKDLGQLTKKGEKS